MQLTKLKNGVSIPTIGLGVFRSSDGEETVNAVKWALEAGYRHIDTATAYGNEGSVGRAIKESGVRREDIFITTKLRNDDNTERRTRAAFEESLRLLDTDYVDLYLIHWYADIAFDCFALAVLVWLLCFESCLLFALSSS